MEKVGMLIEFNISMRLNSLKKAGTKAFYESEELVIQMMTHKYSCYVRNKQQDMIWEKLYHQIPTQET